MEYTRKEFARELGVSPYTVKDWGMKRSQNRSHKLMPARYEKGKAIYTDAELAIARAFLAEKSRPTPNAKVVNLFDEDNQTDATDAPADDSGKTDATHVDGDKNTQASWLCSDDSPDQNADAGEVVQSADETLVVDFDEVTNGEDIPTLSPADEKALASEDVQLPPKNSWAAVKGLFVGLKDYDWAGEFCLPDERSRLNNQAAFVLKMIARADELVLEGRAKKVTGCDITNDDEEGLSKAIMTCVYNLAFEYDQTRKPTDEDDSAVISVGVTHDLHCIQFNRVGLTLCINWLLTEAANFSWRVEQYLSKHGDKNQDYVLPLPPVRKTAAKKDFLPMTLSPDFDSIPQFMRELTRWLCWRLIPADPKPKKVPMSPKNGKLVKASVTAPENWLTFDEALTWYNRGECSGIGFALTNSTPKVCCVDVDHCVLPDGSLNDTAQAVVKTCGDSWAELSQSGTGIHIWFIDEEFSGGRKKDPVEVYAADRYIAMTGNHITTTAADLLSINGTCRKVIAEFIDADAGADNLFEKSVRQAVEEIKTPDLQKLETNPTLTDADRKLIEYFRSSKCTEKDLQMSLLFGGNLPEYFKHAGKDHQGKPLDDSVADCDLMLKILYYVGGEGTDEDVAHRALKIFGQSALARRDKWISREDYRVRTLNAAFKFWDKGGRQCYKPKTQKSDSDADPLTAELREVNKALADLTTQKNSALENLRNVSEFSSNTVFSEEIVEAAAFAHVYDRKSFSDFKREVKIFGDKHKEDKVSLYDWLAEVKAHAAEIETRQADLTAQLVDVQGKIRSRDFVADNEILKGFSLPDGYSIDRGGIVKIEGKKVIPVCRRPVIITGKTYNVEDKIYKLNLAYKPLSGKWKTIPAVSADVTANKNKIIELAKRGVPVTSSNAAHIVDFLDAFDAQNENQFPLTLNVSRCGWHEFDGEEIFVDPRRKCETTYDDQNARVEVDEQSQFAQTLRTSGTLDEWKRAYEIAKHSPVARLTVAAAVAPPLLKILGERNFLVYLFAPTRSGKTTALSLGASAVGNEKMIRSFDGTKNGLAGAAADVNDYAFLVDEKQVADNRIKEQLKELVYALANGIGRTKLNKDSSLKKTKDWRITAVMTGETPYLPDNATGGAFTRLLSIGTTDPILSPDDCKMIRDIIKKNYGHALPLVVDKIVELGADNLREYYEETIGAFVETYPDLLPEYCRYLAVLVIADGLLNSVLGERNALTDATLAMKEIVPFIPTLTEIADTPREKDFVMGFISQNQKLFVEGSAKPEFTPALGRFDPDYIYVSVKPLQDACKTAGFDSRKLAADLIADGFFIPADKVETGRKTPRDSVKQRLGKVLTWCYRIGRQTFDALDE